MKFSSNPLNGKLLKEQKPTAQVNAEKQTTDQLDDSLIFISGVLLAGVDERVPRDPDCQTPSKQGNVSGRDGRSTSGL